MIKAPSLKRPKHKKFRSKTLQRVPIAVKKAFRKARANADDPYVYVSADDPDDEVRVSHSRQEQIVWWSEQHKFRVSLQPKDPDCPEPQPFRRTFPNSQFANPVPSGAPRKTAIGYTYSVSFEFEDGTAGLDPDIIIEV